MLLTLPIVPASAKRMVPSERIVRRVLCLQALHIFALSFFFYPTRTSVLCVSGAISLVLYSFLLYQEVFRESFGISPFIVYLLVGCMRLGLAPIYLSAVVVLGYVDALSFAGHDTSEHYIAGYHLDLLGDWFFLVGYFVFRRFSSPPKPLRFRNPGIGPNALLYSAFFLIALVYGTRLAQYFDFSMSRFGQLYIPIRSYGSSAFLFILIFAIEKASSAKRRGLLFFTAVIFLVELKVALASYMKGDAILYVLPLFIYFFIKVRKITPRFWPRIQYKRLAIAIIVFFIFLSFLFTYSEMRRGAFWEAGEFCEQKPEISSYLFRALGSLIPGSESFLTTHRFPKGGAWRILYRNTLLVGDAWCYSYVKENGTTDGEYFKEIPVILIPRFLWPEKPLVSRGRDIAVLLGQADSVETATTCTVFSMAGGLYWAWGYPCVVVGMLLNGIAFYLAWKVFSPSIILNPISTLVCISLFYHALLCFEGSYDANIIDYILIFAFFLPLSRLWDSAVIIRREGGGK